MRELKFRCWGIKENKYLKLHSIHLSTSKVIVSYYGVGGGNISKALKDVVLEQYTGLKDKNGKEIYEGDILGGIWESGYIAWCNKCKQFQYHIPTNECMACLGDVHWYELVDDDGKLEVIGNIHENPELLKGGK